METKGDDSPVKHPAHLTDTGIGLAHLVQGLLQRFQPLRVGIHDQILNGLDRIMDLDANAHHLRAQRRDQLAGIG